MRSAALALVLIAWPLGCGDDGATAERDGGPDAAVRDASARDASSRDAGGRDAGGEADAGAEPSDAGRDAGPSGTVLFRVTFDDAPLGAYGRDAMDAEWPGIRWANADRASIVEGGDAWSGRSLRILYPDGTFGPGEGGAQWMVDLADSHDELYCSYRVRFAPGFDPVKGGKLPGLAGGEANTGGERPDGTDGWSARMMWRRDLQVVQYVYHVDQPTIYGEDFDWSLGGERHFEPGTWHVVEHRIVMNTPGENDGIVQGWLDGELALDRRDVRFRDVDTFAIDVFYFSTFFGGGDSTWASTRDEYVYFDDFVVSTGPITH